MKILKQVQDDGASILKQVQDDGTMKILYPKGISMLCKGQLNSGPRNSDFFVFGICDIPELQQQVGNQINLKIYDVIK